MTKFNGATVRRDDAGRIIEIVGSRDVQLAYAREEYDAQPRPRQGDSAGAKTLSVLAKAPTALGQFTGEIDTNPPAGDLDRERINSWTNLPTTVPLDFGHVMDGGGIGEVRVSLRPGGRYLDLAAQLDLSKSLAQSVHERLLRGADDPEALTGLSIFASYEPSRTWKAPNGVRVLEGAKLIGVAVVKTPAQRSTISAVKAADDDWDAAALRRALDAVDAREVADVRARVDRASRPRLRPRLPVERMFDGHGREILPVRQP
jgi:hypothetical protein